MSLQYFKELFKKRVNTRIQNADVCSSVILKIPILIPYFFSLKKERKRNLSIYIWFWSNFILKIKIKIFGHYHYPQTHSNNVLYIIALIFICSVSFVIHLSFCHFIWCFCLFFLHIYLLFIFIWFNFVIFISVLVLVILVLHPKHILLQIVAKKFLIFI